MKVKEREVHIPCVTHGSSLADITPLVWLITKSGEIIKQPIYPPKDKLIIKEASPDSRIFKCEVVGEVRREEGREVIVGIKSEGKDTELRIPKKDVVYS